MIVYAFLPDDVTPVALPYVDNGSIVASLSLGKIRVSFVHYLSVVGRYYLVQCRV